jgi:magnesium transporter
MNSKTKKYLKYINPLEMLQTKKVLKNNPTLINKNDIDQASVLSLYQFNEKECVVENDFDHKKVSNQLFSKGKNYWLNSDIINKNTVEEISAKLGLHYLIVEDILSENERPKTDEIENRLVCVLHMLYYNEELQSIENEQVSLVLGDNFLISFQDDSIRDSFNPIREKLAINGTKIRTQGVDYLLYGLIDSIVDHFFIVLEKLGDRIEHLEEEISTGNANNFTMNQINTLKKELMFFKRNAFPVKDLINNIIKTENPLITENSKKYFKDVYDHAVQVNDLIENYRDLITNIRDLYLSQMNLKLNEVMKFLAIVTALLAPATVIGGIFGMNFDRIPYLHHQDGFWIATFLMLIIPFLMLVYFRKRSWF